MDIQEQIDQFLQIPEIKEIFSDHDIHWHVGEYSQGWYFDFSVPDYEKGFFLGAWNAWQAAKAQAVPEWISTTDQLPVVKKCSEKLFNVVMLDYKSEPFVTSLTYMHEYEFYDSEDNFESERNEDGYVYHTGWVNHLNDDFFESIEADKVLYWMELPRVIEAQEQKG